MNIEDWFDPHNKDHIKAYFHLQKEGQWPKGFIPEDIEFHPNWHLHVLSVIAGCWIEQEL